MTASVRPTALAQLLGLSFLVLLASCDSNEVADESGGPSSEVTATVDTGAAVADAGQGILLPEPGWSIEEGLTVELEFTGRYNSVTGELEFEFEDTSVPVSANGLRTAGQALWCADRIAVVQDGVAGSNPPNTFELVSDSLGTYAECDPATFPDGTPAGISYANLVETDGALCSTVTIRSFYDYGFEDVHAWIYEVNPVDNYAYTWGDRVTDGYGNGAEPPVGANAPSDNLGGLFFYGDMTARDLSGAVDNALSQPWVFRYPIDGADFNFRGKLVARFTETCNGQDDDCDGRVDEGANCLGPGSVCVDATDCAPSPAGDPVLCVASAGGGGTTCGGGILQEDCGGTVDTNGDGRVGCLDPTCSGVGTCADASCVQGNLGNEVSSFEGDPVATGTVTETSVGAFSLPVGQERCSSRFQGAERSWIWTAPANGTYTISTVGSSYDTALMVVRGECPADLVAAFNGGTAFCSEGAVVGTQAEEVTLAMTAGETALIIVDSSYLPVLSIGRGTASVSIFKSAVCGDGYRDAQDRFGAVVEACDSGAVNTATCDADCTAVVCGDGFNNTVVEGCEDGNSDPGDGCTALCTIEPGFNCPGGTDCEAECGDGIVAGPEVCDDSNVVDTDGCSDDCLAQDSRWDCVPGLCTPICGDGVTVGVEVCDSSGGIGCESCLLVTPGYRCPPTGGACSDIDECAEGINACSIFGLCENLPGTYACSCDVGFTGDGFICSDVNECLTANGGCSAAATCTNNDGGRVCACNAGYTGDGLVCNDIDECEEDIDGCDPLVDCNNTPGSFNCGACPAGYTGTGATGCLPLSCNDPGAPLNGVQVGVYASFVLGTEVTFACNTGYSATAGDLVRTCEPDGVGGVRFSGTAPVCSPVPCPAPVPPANATLSDAPRTYAYQDVATFACNAGYVLNGAPALTRTCGPDGSFGAATGTCERIDCNVLSNPANGTVTTASGTLFEAEATYSCNAGYELVGASTRTCTATGAWSGSTPTCERITCSPPSPPANAVQTGGPYTYESGETVTFACNSGWQAVGSLSRTCGLDGNYSAPAGSCQRISCGPLSAPANGNISAGDTLFETERTFACDTGYVASGSSVRRCESNGVWSGTEFSCTIFDCGAAPTPANGTIASQTGTTFNSTVSYACNSGYERTAGDTGLTCSASGWVGIPPTCSRVVCPAVTPGGPQAPVNASIATGGNGPHVFEDAVSFTCNTGFELTSGDLVRTCQANGTWTGSAANCTPITCTNPGVPSFGLVTSGNGGLTSYAFGDVMTFACNNGFTPVGSLTLTCGSGTSFTGRWDFPIPTCDADSCGALPEVLNSTTSPAVPVTTTGQSVTYTCNTGYTLTAGDATRTCQPTRVWSGTSPTCSPVSCGNPTTPVGQLRTGAGYTFTFGETVTNQCAPGWERSGGTSDADLSITCQANTTWTPPTATCVRRSCGAAPATPNATLGSTTGTNFESVATYSCSSGFTANGTAPTRTCQADGTWSAPSFACDPVACPANPPAGDAFSTLSNTGTGVFLAEATYACNANARIGGTPGGLTTYTRTCQATGTWSSPSAACAQVNCGTLTATSPLSVNTPGGTLFGATATYTCGTGFRLSAAGSRTCQASGWSGTAPTCNPLTCLAPTPVSPGGLVSPNTSGQGVASVVTHSCDGANGFQQSGGTTTQSCVDAAPGNANGTWTWSGAPLTCALRECPSFDIADSTETVTTSVGPNGRSVGSVVGFSCAPGFVIQGTGTTTASRTCEATGSWSNGGLPVCVRRACAALPAAPGTVSGGPAYGFPATYSTPVSTTTATYTCAPGTRVGGSPTGATSSLATCGSDGNWSAWSGTCAPVNCGSAPAAAVGSNSSLGTVSGTGLGGTATYDCTGGFALTSDPASPKLYSRVCTDGVGWSTPADTTCEQFQCPELSNIVDIASGLTAAVVSYPGTTRFAGQTAQYTRQTGFSQAGGDSLRTCLANGSWSGVAPSFDRMSCPPIPTPTTPSPLTVTYLNLSNAPTTDRFVGHTASFGCGGGFSPSPATVQTCRETSATSVQWQTTPGTPASNPVCSDNNECLSSPNCGSNATCNNIAGSYQCVCNAAAGWAGTTTTGGPATCSPDCGDGIRVGAEVCDDGVWNDRPAAGQPNPAGNHPRYGATDCEGRACDCTTNSFPSANYPGCTPRTVCREASGIECTALSPTTPGRCADGLDNDGDGLSDCFDPECSDKDNCANWNSPTCGIQNFLGSRINSPSSMPLGTYSLTAIDPNNWTVSWAGVPRGGADEGFLWQAPQTGTYRISTCGTNFDTILAVFSGVVCSDLSSPPTHFASIDDGGTTGCTGTFPSQLDISVTAGQWYTIVVTARSNGTFGTFPLNITPVSTQICGDGTVAGYQPVGVTNTARIPNARMTGSANFSGGEPWKGRLNGFEAFSSSAGCNENSWLQVDLSAPSRVSGIATQGNGSSSFNEFVTSYRVRYSNDGVTWSEVGGTTASTGTLFQGNVDRATTRWNNWPAITARYWRIHPISCYNGGTPAMRIELYANAEECDDANAIDNDTCSNSCRINSDPFPSCAPTVQTNVVSVLGPVGGAGGGASVGTPNLVSACPPGMVAAGTYGRGDAPFAGATWVSRFGVRCAPMIVNPGNPATISRGGVQDAASLGRNTGTNFALDCPANQFLIGVNFLAGGVIDQFQSICGSFTYSNGNATITRTTNGTTGTIGGFGGGPAQLLCPGNQVVTGVQASSDTNWVVTAGITCAPIQPIFNNAGGGGGGDFSSTCPTGTVAIGFDGTSRDSYVDRLRTVCAPMPVLNTATTPDSWSLTRGQGVYFGAATGSGGTTPYDLQCPAGQYVIGINANAGSRVDFMNAICGTFTLSGGVVTRTQQGNTGNTNTGGGGLNVMLCPGNGVVSAIRGRSGSWLDAVAIQCTQVTAECDATPRFGLDVYNLTGMSQPLADFATRTYPSRVPYCGQVQQIWTSLGFSPQHPYSSDIETSISNSTFGLTNTLWMNLFSNSPWLTRSESWTLSQPFPGRGSWVFSVTDDVGLYTSSISSLNVNFLCRP